MHNKLLRQHTQRQSIDLNYSDDRDHAEWVADSMILKKLQRLIIQVDRFQEPSPVRQRHTFH